MTRGPRYDRAWAGIMTASFVWGIAPPAREEIAHRLRLVFPDDRPDVVDIGACTRTGFLDAVRSRLHDGPTSARVVRSEHGVAVMLDHGLGDASLLLAVLQWVTGRSDERPEPGRDRIGNRAVARIVWRLAVRHGGRARLACALAARVTRRLRAGAHRPPAPPSGPGAATGTVCVRIPAAAVADLRARSQERGITASTSLVLFLAVVDGLRRHGVIDGPARAHLMVSLRRFDPELRRSGGNVVGSFSWRPGRLGADEVATELRRRLRGGEMLLDFLFGRVLAPLLTRRRVPGPVVTRSWNVSWSDVGRFTLRDGVTSTGDGDDGPVAGFLAPVVGRFVSLSKVDLNGDTHIVCSFDAAVVNGTALREAVEAVAASPIDPAPPPSGPDELRDP